MGCIIKIKGRNQFKEFKSIEEAKEWVQQNRNKLSIEEFSNYKNGKKEYFLETKTIHESVVKTLQSAHLNSFTQVGEVISKMDVDGFETQEYGAKSDALSLMQLLKSLRVEDQNGESKRLFPEFINSNFINVTYQNLILKKLLFNDLNIDENVDELVIARRKYFNEDIIPNEWKNDNKIHDPKSWYGLLIKKYGHDFSNILTDSDFEQITLLADNIQNNNFDGILRGELGHKIFELIIKNKSQEQIKQSIVDPEKGLFASFNEKYANEKYQEVTDAEKIINNLKDQFNNTNLFDQYYKTLVKFKSQIEERFKRGNPNAEITWLPELMITTDIDGTIDGKQKIRGKIDIVVVVDNIPHIIDLKFSKKEYSDWDSAKVLKTDYQLASYLRMLNKIGVSTSNTTLQVAAVTYDRNGNLSNPTIINRTSDISKQIKITDNLNTVFSHIVQDMKLSPKIFEDVQKKFNDLFGVSTAKGRKDITEEQTYSILKNNVRHIDGKYRLSYWIFDRKSARRENKYVILDSNKEKREAELKNIAKDIVQQNSLSFSIQYDTLVDDINGLLTNTLDIKDFVSAANDINLINFYSALLLKYKGSGAQVIKSDLAKANNMIIIKTKIGIDIITLSSLDIDAAYDQTDKNANLFSTLGESSINLKKTIGNVSISKALLVADELLKNTSDTINNITCIQLGVPKGHFLRVSDLKAMSDIISSNGLKNKFADPLTVVLNDWINFVNTLKHNNSMDITPLKMTSLKNINRLSATKKDLLKDLLSGNLDILNNLDKIEDFTLSQKITTLEYLRDSLKLNYPTLFKNINKPALSPETWLMYDIEKAIRIYNNNEVADEIELKKYALGSSTLFSPLDVIPNENAQIISRAINDAFTKITERVTKFTAKNRVEVDKLKESKGYSKFRQYTVGDTVLIYDNLFVKNKDHKAEDLILKNPWTDSKLTNQEREFIKFALFTFNKKRYKWNSIDDIDPNELTEVDYYVPLVRSTGLYKFRDANGKFNISVWRSTWEKMRQSIINAGDLFEEQIQERKKASDNFEKFYNQYSIRRNKDVRKDLIGRLGIGAFSTDLETILTEYTVAEESQEIFDNETIPLVRSVLYVSQFGSYISGNNQEVFKEFIEKTVKNVIYKESVMSEEVQKYMKKLAPLQSAAFMTTLAWNIGNVPREVLMGFFTNISRAMIKSYGENSFNLKDYTKAFSIMCADIPGFIKNVTKIEMLNEFYRMANMSITEIPEQVTSNKTGVMASFSRFLSWALTAPDYWNRMSIFIAQMIHDGTWEAHSIEVANDGSKYLKYDITKDKRFDIFVKYKGDISKVPNSLKEKYNYQEALYYAMLEEINKTSDSPYIYKPGTIPFLEKAYTNRQRASFKSFADTTFGYYDPEGKALFFKTAVGQIFKQFMAYFAGKKVQYYQTGSNNTARGDFKQLTDIKGEKIWRIVDSNGTIINKKDSELTNEERLIAKPVLAWSGTYLEGIFQSYVHLFKEVGMGTWDALRGKDTDAFKNIFNEYLKKGNIRNSNLLQSFWDILMGSFLMYILRLIFFDDPEVTGISYTEQLRSSSGWAQFWYNATNQATQDFDIAQLIKNGIFVWESPSLGILQRSVTNFWRNLGDEDLSIAEATLSSTVETVGFLKPIRPYMSNIKEDWKED